MFINLEIISAVFFATILREIYVFCWKIFLLSVAKKNFQHQGCDRVKFLATSGPNDWMILCTYITRNCAFAIHLHTVTCQSSSGNHIHNRSVNLEYNTLICWTDGTNVSLTKRLMFQVLLFFFIKSCKILCKNIFNYFSYFSMKLQKWK